MQKILQTCFLGYLCLIGSQISAQSKVAESPGVDLLHKVSDPNRGGETLSDTFLEYNGQEISKLPLHSSGLWTVDNGLKDETAASPQKAPRSDLSTLPSSFSFVDQHLDPGAGEGTLRLHPAPVTVLAHQLLEDTATYGKVVVYVETRRVPALDSLEFRLWNPYLNERDLPLPEVDQLLLQPGSMFDGSRETARGQWESGTLSGYGRLTLRFDRFEYLDRFLVEPGDSVRVRLDFENARALFSGPAADKFRCQYELANAYENYRYDQNPTMFTQQSDYWGYSDTDSLSILEIRGRESSIRRRMEFISPGEKGLHHLENIFSMDVFSHPGFEVLEHYENKLDPDFLAVLRADLVGRIYHDQIVKFSTYYQEDEAHLKFFEANIADTAHEIPRGAGHSAYYPEYLYQKLAVVSALTKEPFRNLLGGLPEDIHDQVYAKYIFKNYRRFKDSNRQFELAMGQVRNPLLLEELGRLYSAQRIGERIASIPLTDREGNELSLTELEGKVLLVSFWLPGCQASSEGYKSLIHPVEEYFSGDDEISFVYVSHDSNLGRWSQNIASGDYATSQSLNLNASYQDHPFLDYYNIRYFPTYMVVDAQGNVQNIGNIPKTPDGLIQYLKATMADSSSTFSSPNL
ncbi:TlpA family protein disulfide reductase [Algoriphagus terrigena]|uniref:TlpA family protein disulfide reductase n=1 Tax=Algoriphagus terrigena TaxID=344884 RepID=UPI00047CB9C8|nr:thioredoxin-like domain-containing protein [Algoriphagus terrigena]